jgi:hypothetical protein
VDFEPAAQRQNLSSGEVLGEKAVRAMPERQEKAAWLRDEVKRLREMELDTLEGRSTNPIHRYGQRLERLPSLTS